jgi:hypothetical protein
VLQHPAVATLGDRQVYNEVRFVIPVDHNVRSIPSPAEVRQQVDRLLASPVLSGAEVPQHLLSFLTDRSLSSPGQPIKEHEIATTVMRRSADFDPRIDSVVRVQIARLRSKLAEYYVGAGQEDGVLIEIPKGLHQIRATWRQVSLRPSTAGERDPPPPAWRAHRLLERRPLIVTAVLVLCAASAVLVSRKWGNSPSRTFWEAFLDAPRDPLLIFSNPSFAGSSDTSLRYFREGTDPPEALNDTYTGTGEVMAVHQVTRTFASFGRPLRVKRAHLLTWDEARENHLIIIGSPEQNPALSHLTPLSEFRFKPYSAEPRAGYGAVVNLRPGPGEEMYYFASPARPIRYDYAIIALIPSITSSRHALVLAGTTTYGTQAAAEFVCNPARVEELLAKLGVSAGAPMPPFEAVLYVQITGGVPTDSYIQVVRRHPAGKHENASGNQSSSVPDSRLSRAP